MTRTSLARESRAAHAASQRLFHVLHHASARVGEQKQRLAKARDTVRHTHEHGTCVAAAVKAWRDATETYRDVFAHLAAVAAPDPSEGRAAATGHRALLRMADSARTANELAVSSMSQLPQPALSGPLPGAKRGAAAEEPTAKRSRVHHETQGHPQPPPPTARVEYEDLTAEVEARLAAKAESERARQQRESEKKRKRDSADSSAHGRAATRARAGTPAEKKAKRESTTAPSAPGKRRFDHAANTIDGGGATHKKRKRR